MRNIENLEEKMCDSVQRIEKLNTLVYKEFKDFLRKNNPFLVKRLRNILETEYGEWDVIIRTKFLAQYPKYIPDYYKILSTCGYRQKDDLLACFSDLCSSSYSEKKIKEWEHLPTIDKIIYEKQTKAYTVYTLNEVYSFFPVREKYTVELENIIQTHKEIYEGKIDIFKTCKNGYNPEQPGNLDYACHFSTFHFTLYHPEFYAATCYCPHCYTDAYWYHSFAISPDLKAVVDIANGFVMDSTSFTKLIEPTIMAKTQGALIDDKLLEISHKTHKPYLELYEDPLLNIALFEYESAKKEKPLKRTRKSIEDQ